MAVKSSFLSVDDDALSQEELVGASGLNDLYVPPHNGFANGARVDFSNRRIGLEESQTLKWYQEFDTRGYYTKAGGMRSFKDD